MEKCFEMSILIICMHIAKFGQVRIEKCTFKAHYPQTQRIFLLTNISMFYPSYCITVNYYLFNMDFYPDFDFLFRKAH